MNAEGLGKVEEESFLCQSPVGQLYNVPSEKLQNSLMNFSASSWAVIRPLPRQQNTGCVP